MVKIEIKTVNLTEIKLNPDNPRTISKKDMDLLVKSLKDFPEMLELREIVVDETMTVLGGNMRTLALRKVGVKEATAKIVSGLTPEQKREFIIKDNSNYGTYDLDALANSWGDLPLVDWGVDLPADWLGGGSGPSGIADAGESNYKEQYGVIIICKSAEHQEEVYNKILADGYECKVVVT